MFFSCFTCAVGGEALARAQPTVQETYLMLDAAISLGKRLHDQQELQLQL